MTILEARPAGPALDLTENRVQALIAKNEQLRTELAQLQAVVDDLLDRESMHAGAACMEQLTTAAAISRLGAPRARHLPTPVDTACAAIRLEVRA